MNLHLSFAAFATYSVLFAGVAGCLSSLFGWWASCTAYLAVIRVHARIVLPLLCCLLAVCAVVSSGSVSLSDKHVGGHVTYLPFRSQSPPPIHTPLPMSFHRHQVPQCTIHLARHLNRLYTCLSPCSPPIHPPPLLVVVVAQVEASEADQLNSWESAHHRASVSSHLVVTAVLAAMQTFFNIWIMALVNKYLHLRVTRLMSQRGTGRSGRIQNPRQNKDTQLPSRLKNLQYVGSPHVEQGEGGLPDEEPIEEAVVLELPSVSAGDRVMIVGGFVLGLVRLLFNGSLVVFSAWSSNGHAASWTSAAYRFMGTYDK